ncbi:hypothetical protein D1007_25317 [Hordeum vulgare]|nr:hypothetical protein D1007_25317 [Hordeum vulgare]
MDPYAPATPRGPVSSRRAELYGRMARDLDERGAAFLKGGETSQSLALSDLFEVRDGAVVPKLKVKASPSPALAVGMREFLICDCCSSHQAADPPVRANVLYLDPEFAAEIA